ncbi:MAG: arsenate reductase [Porticoccaceae bacterium]|nr:MAG: arsenate reductase [Porticoccaceae bacterium]
MNDSPVVLYGIPNCDRVRAARRWLRERGVPHRFHDLRADGAGPELFARWLAQVGPARLINRHSATWRALAEGERQQLAGPAAAEVLARHPTLAQRPVLEVGERLWVGFDPAAWAALLALEGGAT